MHLSILRYRCFTTIGRWARTVKARGTASFLDLRMAGRADKSARDRRAHARRHRRCGSVPHDQGRRLVGSEGGFRRPKDVLEFRESSSAGYALITSLERRTLTKILRFYGPDD